MRCCQLPAHLIDACNAEGIIADSTNDSRDMGAMAMDIHAVSGWRVNIEVGTIYVINHTCTVHCCFLEGVTACYCTEMMGKSG